MLNKKIAFIGPGVMAEAMIAGLLRKKLAKPENITASGPREERGTELQKKYGIQTTTDNASAASQADVVVLSVKPQRLSEVMKGLKGIPRCVGAFDCGRRLHQKDQHGPETQSRGPFDAEYARSDRRRDHRLDCIEGSDRGTTGNGAGILGALGEEVFVEDESYLDMATALSGTGPAYVFLFTEALIDAGVHMGFPRRIAEQLVLQTIKGSAAFYEQAERHPATLRNQVTSPGGTSAEALYYLEKAGFRTAISRAVWAAYQRSLELGKEKPGHIPETHEEEEVGTTRNSIIAVHPNAALPTSSPMDISS